MADLFDPTPVMVNSGTYYPGNNAKEPTALSTGVASSLTIGTDAGCGQTPTHRFDQMGKAALHDHGSLLNPAKQEEAAA